MTGLLALFGRHFVVLTNFLVKEAKSRRIGPEAAFQGPSTGRATAGGPTGPGGWDWDRPRRRTPGDASSPPDHPLQPLQGLRGPLRCLGTPPRAAGWVPGITPPAPTPVPIPHPYTLPLTPPYPHTTTVHHTLTACTYGRFGIPVGEPRGVEYQLSLGSQAGILLYLGFTRPFDWVLHPFYHCFTEFSTCFY